MPEFEMIGEQLVSNENICCSDVGATSFPFTRIGEGSSHRSRLIQPCRRADESNQPVLVVGFGIHAEPMPALLEQVELDRASGRAPAVDQASGVRIARLASAAFTPSSR